jgi:cytochrome b involved in lipid metabolism
LLTQTITMMSVHRDEDNDDADLSRMTEISWITEMEQSVLNSSPMKTSSEYRRSVLLQLNHIKHTILMETESVTGSSLHGGKKKGVDPPPRGMLDIENGGEQVRGVLGLASSPPPRPPSTIAIPSDENQSDAHTCVSSLATRKTYTTRHAEEEKPTRTTTIVDMQFMHPSSKSLNSLNSASSKKSLFLRDERKEKAVHVKATCGYTPDLLDFEKPPQSGLPDMWALVTYLLTFPISDRMISKDTPGAKQAWREKVTTFIIFLMLSATFVVVVTFLPLALCQEAEDHVDMDQVSSSGWTVIFGKVYDLEEFASFHPGGSKTVEAYAGKDASSFFPRLPPTDLSSLCLNPALSESVFDERNSMSLQNITCSGVSSFDELRYGDPCHYDLAGMDAMDDKLGKYVSGYNATSTT